jgi:hypothetical protein
MEVGHLADHFADLACFRGRHPVENMGDVKALFDHYAKSLGQPLDLDAVAYQTVVFLAYALFTPLFGLKEPSPGGDWSKVPFRWRSSAAARRRPWPKSGPSN